MTNSVDRAADAAEPDADLNVDARRRAQELLLSTTQLAAAAVIRPADVVAKRRHRLAPPMSRRVSLRRLPAHQLPVLRRRPRL
ncbi:hypothetical protein ACFXG4_30450 [Nocardia sp. NPDC059246]|uniref:hypothetical protein n=1 Tax=unclassified Nocardia TaxID=2637762 RepID=UPI0036A2C2D9